MKKMIFWYCTEMIEWMFKRRKKTCAWIDNGANKTDEIIWIYLIWFKWMHFQVYSKWLFCWIITWKSIHSKKFDLTCLNKRISDINAIKFKIPQTFFSSVYIQFNEEKNSQSKWKNVRLNDDYSICF